jgi:prepilin-type N-terminal cleavage/methylation domain-containing protein
MFGPCGAHGREVPRALHPARPGFTLIEIIVTIIILTVAAAVAAPAFRALYQEDPLTAAEHRMEALFRLARDSAIRSGRPVTVVIDSLSGLVWLDAPPFAGTADSIQEASLAQRSSSVIGMRAPTMPSARRPEVTTGTSLDFPSGIRLDLMRARARFAFAPTGSAFPDTVWLRSSVVTRGVTLDPWTGDAIIF